MEFANPTAEEFPFVFDAWANSYRKSPWAGTTPNHLYGQVSRETMTGIMDRGARVIVAVTPIAGREEEYPDVRRVMGYSVSDPARKILHWLYVKRDYRGFGIARQLLKATCPGDDRWTYTHRMPASAKFLGSRFVWDDVSARVKA